MTSSSDSLFIGPTFVLRISVGVAPVALAKGAWFYFVSGAFLAIWSRTPTRSRMGACRTLTKLTIGACNVPKSWANSTSREGREAIAFSSLSLTTFPSKNPPLILRFSWVLANSKTAFAVAIALFATNAQFATVDLLLSPVFHKFPRLRVALSEGGIGWMDNLAIPKGAPDVDNAKKFINFMMDPENAAIESNFAGYQNAVVGSNKFLDPKMAAAPEFNPAPDYKIVFSPGCDAKAWAKAGSRLICSGGLPN